MTIDYLGIIVRAAPSLFAAVSAPLGYWFLDRVPDEVERGRSWASLPMAVLSFLPFILLVWWHAALITGALLLGGPAAIVGLALLSYAPYASGVPALLAAQLAIVIGLLVGLRWRLDERRFLVLACSAGLLAFVGIVLAVLGITLGS